MLVSFVIFHKSGLILYQHLDESTALLSSLSSPPSTSSSSSLDPTSSSIITKTINTWLTEIYLNPTISKSIKKNSLLIDNYDNKSITTTKTVVEWEETSELIMVAIYPELRHEDFPWIRTLMLTALQEYQLFLKASLLASSNRGDNNVVATAATVDNQTKFDKTFQVLFQKHRKSSSNNNNNNAKENNIPTTTITTNISKATGSPVKNNNNNKNGNNSAGGSNKKEKRQWHDGKAKVTKEAMAELDRSKAVTEEQVMKSEEQALAEARAAYLPTDTDLAEFAGTEQTIITELIDEDDDNVSTSISSSSTWGQSLQGLFEHMTGQKVLTKQDLDLPLLEMHKLLTSKNVATDIATQICNKVQETLVGKKLNSMYRVKTAVRQAIEHVINQLLLPSTELNLLRQVITKRDQSSSLFFARSKTQRRPYVIVVVGINGVGKSTSLAKLAYYLKSNGCNPLLAACDTFRSGAVEQLSVHAKCLDVPIYSKGYSKDPSSVAKAAIEVATQEGNDVVLVDTAGRMQNNLPLMKALGKLAFENQPDMIVFVGEALVGNDGVDQVKMFDKAVSFQSKTQKVHAILLTKFDTVSDKVGAALTMTHVTNAPILFVGTGQKYHHLQKLSTAAVIRSLFQ